MGVHAVEVIALVLLGAVALAQIFQTVLALRMAQSGARAMERFESMAARIDAELHPQMVQLARITTEVEDLTRRAAEQWPAVESALQDGARAARILSGVAETVGMATLGPIAKGLALVRGLRAAVAGWRHPTPRPLQLARPPSRDIFS
jgi:hypothetical protein